MALFNVAPTKFWSPISVSTNSFTAEASGPSFVNKRNKELFIPTMAEIMESSKHQNLRLQLQTLGPFFRISARSLETEQELGRADGFIRLWFGGRILHLDSIRLKRETVSLQRSIFGTGLYVGAVAVRHGYDCGCQRTELLAINDTDLYHSKLVRFYKRMGFKAVHEVTGSSIGDLSHMLVWGGKGTRMDADIQELLLKWGSRFKARKVSEKEPSPESFNIPSSTSS